MPIRGVKAVVVTDVSLVPHQRIIRARVCCTRYPREGFAAVGPFVLLAGQYFNFSLVSAVKDVLELLPKRTSVEFLCQGSMGKNG